MDTDLLLRSLTLRGPASDARLVEAISAPPELSRTIDGATTLTVDVQDTRRRLLRSGMFDTRSWAVVDGLHFELVQVGKVGDTITLTFEDAIVAALRRRDSPRSFEAGTATRQQIATELAAEAGVAIAIDPTARPVVAAAVDRSADGQKSTSWDVLGTLADTIDWRRFSDGQRLLFGSDAWLSQQYPRIRLAEHIGPVNNIDFDLDVGKPASRATVTVDATRWSVPPAQPVKLLQHGPATGDWLVESYTRPLTRRTGTVELTRERPTLDEPPPDVEPEGEAGEGDFLPEVLGIVDEPTNPAPVYRDAAERQAAANGRALGAPGSTAVERMLAYALAQRGKPYVWGASGPGSFDCSGLVQEATRAAGNVLVKPSGSQWATCQRLGRTVSVETALRTRGALLFRIGRGSNHVAISLGDGTTVEARGTAYGCGVFNRASHQGWTGGALWAGYGGGQSGGRNIAI